MKLRYLIKKVGSELTKRAPGIAFVGGMIGLGVTVYETIRVTKTIQTEIKAKEDEFERELTKREKAKIIVKNGWPVAVIALCTGGCFTFSFVKELKSIAILSSGLQAEILNMKSYQDVVLEEVGKEKSDEIYNKWVAERARQSIEQIPDDDIPMPVLDTQYLFYEPITGTPFVSTFDNVYTAMRYVNREMDCDPFGGPVKFKEFLSSLPELRDASDADCGEMLGWLPKKRDGDTIMVRTDNAVPTSKGPAWLIVYDPEPVWLDLSY